MHKKKLTIVAALVVITLAAFVATALRFTRPSSTLSDAEYLALLPKVMTLIKQRYVEKPDDKKLVEGAVNGMLAALDPHSAYMPPEFFKEMNIEITGSFGGLGIEITMTDHRLTVIAPIDDTPAFRAGIKAGDIIWKIDGKLTQDLNINEAVTRMRGPQGTGVNLTVIRKSVSKPLVFNLVRDIIRTRSMKARTLEKGYGYVRIGHFQERTGEEFAAALENLRKENGGLRGLVIDLRNNPGGLLESAVAVAGRFIDAKAENGLIVYTKGREASSRMTLTTGMNNKEPRYPVVVLINGGSASASEIVAGALQDHKRAVIMGTQSFGKGSVQTIFPLPGGAGLKLTTARYYTPKGRSIQAKGITPDIVVESGDTPVVPDHKELPFHEKDLDNHISNGLKNQGDAIQPPASVSAGSEVKDNQLARALDLLKSVASLGASK